MSEKFSQLEALRAVLALDLGVHSKMLLAALVSRADARGDSYPPIACLVRDTGMKKRKVQMTIRGLEASGVVSVVVGGSTPEGKRASVYRLNLKTTSTGAPHAPVHDMHPCTKRHGPVHETTPTGAPHAPQESIQESIQESKREIAPEALTLVSPEPSKPKVKKIKADPHLADAIAVLEHWATHPRLYPKRKPNFGAKEIGKVKARLADGYTVDQLRAVIENVAASDYHVAKGHKTAEMMFRDTTNVEKYLELRPSKPKAAPAYQGDPEAPQTFWNEASGDI